MFSRLSALVVFPKLAEWNSIARSGCHGYSVVKTKGGQGTYVIP